MDSTQYIQRLARNMALQEEDRRRSEQRFAAPQRPPAPEASPRALLERNAKNNAQLLNQFGSWAERHDIPYDSPSLFAHGWQLGVRGIALRTFRKGTSDGQIHDELSGPVPEIIGHEYTLRSLILRRSGRLGEIRIVSSSSSIPTEAPEPEFLARLQIAFPAENVLGRYPHTSIANSIARISFQHGVQWEP